MLFNEEKRKEIKSKIDNILNKELKEKQEKSEENSKEDKYKPIVWSPFAKKIYTDIKLYFSRLKENQYPTREVAIKFRNDIEQKLEKGKEKDELIKYYNYKFKLPGVLSLPWNYFVENYNIKEIPSGKWIKAKDFMPPMTDKVLNKSDIFLIFNGKEILLGYLQYDYLDPKNEKPVWKESGRDAYTINNVTHLMKLPKPPIFSEDIIMLEKDTNETMIKDTLAFWKNEQRRAHTYSPEYLDLVNWNISYFEKMLKKTI